MTAPTWAPWAAVLDRLEADVARAEELAEDPTGPAAEPWSVPQVEGPMPPHLVERAQDILARQRQAQQALSMSLNATVRQQEFATKVDRATRRSELPIFLDVTA